MISKEVQMAVDEIHRERDALAAAKKATELQGSQIAEQGKQIDDLKSQIESLKAGSTLSTDDKQALLDAVNEAQTTNEAAQQTNSELATAVPANVDASVPPGAAVIVEPVPPPNDPGAPRPDPIPGTGQNGTVPLMPNLAFDPAGDNAPPPASAGQPNQPAAIETSGGFVVSGGGAVQRAPGTPDVHPMSEAGLSGAAFGTDPNAGPTVSEYVAAGYLARDYPPEGYVSRSTPEEIAAAIAAQEAAPPPSPPPAAPAPAPASPVS